MTVEEFAALLGKNGSFTLMMSLFDEGTVVSDNTWTLAYETNDDSRTHDVYINESPTLAEALTALALRLENR